MGSFRIWLEQAGMDQQPTILRKDQYQVVQKLYDATIKALGVSGAPKAVATTTLSDIQDTDANPNKPPSKGVRVVLNKLQNVFNQLSKVPHFEDRVSDAQNWLQKLSSPSGSGEPRPNDNIATLLKKMFGDDALETYGERKWKGAAAPEAKQPQQNNLPGQDATAPPMGQDGQPPADPTGGAGGPPQDPTGGMPGADPTGGAGGMPGADPSMGADPTGGMGGQPPMDPSMGGMDPNMMAQMGGQPDPNAALQSPGGPFPPKPPGGLPMA